MSEREFVCLDEEHESITQQNNGEFLKHFQKAILASLLKRELLTRSQFNRCNEELEKQFVRGRNKIRNM